MVPAFGRDHSVLTVMARQACLGAERSAMLWSISAVAVGLAMRPDYVNALLSRSVRGRGSDLKPGSDREGRCGDTTPLSDLLAGGGVRGLEVQRE